VAPVESGPASDRTAPNPLPMHAAISALLLAAAAAPSVHGSPHGTGPGPAAHPTPAPQTSQTDERRERVIELVRAGELGAARDLLDDIFHDERMATAAALLAAGEPAPAIDAADEALDVEGRPRADRAAAWMLRGKAVFAAVEAGALPPAAYGEAQENFETAAAEGAGVAAALRASRAARMIGATDEALELARSAVRFIDGGEGRAEGLDVDQHHARTWAEAAFARFVEVAGSGANDEASLQLRKELADETRGALERVIGDMPTDAWAYQQLGNLALWQGDQDGAVAAAEAGLFAAPDAQVMHTAVVQALGNRAEAAARARGLDEDAVLDARTQAIVARYGELLQRYPEKALFYWFPAYETFFKASRDVRSGADARELFVDAEAFFESCRERDASYRAACIDYEILCRNGAALSMINVGETDAAVEVLFSAEELRPIDSPAVTEEGRAAGLEVAYPPYMQSSLALLSVVIQDLMRDPTDRDALTRAAALADRQFALRPEDPNLANNAGFLNRDAAMLWEAGAQRALARAADDPAAEDGAAALRAKAQELIERSWEAYRVAARLVPDDVRVVNDTGLIMAYYVRTDPDLAVEYFQDAIRDGAEQLAAAREMAPDALAAAGIELPALTEAYGDAHENMGIVEWTFRRDPEAALTWFQQALEIGPPSRNWMKRQLLPLLQQWIETGERPAALDALEARTVWVHNQP